jgi:hypothetical protein
VREFNKRTVALVSAGLFLAIVGATLFTYTSQSYDHTVRAPEGEYNPDFNYPNLSSDARRAFSKALEGVDESDPYDYGMFSIKKEMNKPSEFEYRTSRSYYIINYKNNSYELSTSFHREDPTIGRPVLGGFLFVLGLGISAVGLKYSSTRQFRVAVVLGVLTAVLTISLSMKPVSPTSLIEDVGLNIIVLVTFFVTYYIAYGFYMGSDSKPVR